MKMTMSFKFQLAAFLLTLSAFQTSFAKKIDGSDLRKVDRETLKTFPISNIGILKWRDLQKPAKIEVCTVTLVNAQFALTAKHCIQDLNDESKKIQFVLRVGNTEDTQAEYGIDDIIEFQNVDVALIKVSPTKSAVNMNKYPTLVVPSESDLMRIAVYGYPVTSPNLDLHFSNCSAQKDSDPSLLTHFCSTEVGVSGAPIFSIDESGEYKIIGIHSGSNFFSGNRASIINDKLLQMINAEISK